MKNSVTLSYAYTNNNIFYIINGFIAQTSRSMCSTWTLASLLQLLREFMKNLALRGRGAVVKSVMNVTECFLFPRLVGIPCELLTVLTGENERLVRSNDVLFAYVVLDFCHHSLTKKREVADVNKFEIQCTLRRPSPFSGVTFLKILANGKS